MTDSAATLVAAVIGASIAGLGLAWSVVGFFLTRRALRASTAREEWSRRFDKAHALAFSTDAKEAASGLALLRALTKERWVTDEDRATAVSILASITGVEDATVADLQANILGQITNRSVANELGEAAPGPRGRFELYQDRAGEHRWRMKAANGQVLAISEGFPNRMAALSSIELVRRTFGGTDETGSSDSSEAGV